jgi:hypothetical protein
MLRCGGSEARRVVDVLDHRLAARLVFLRRDAEWWGRQRDLVTGSSTCAITIPTYRHRVCPPLATLAIDHTTSPTRVSAFLTPWCEIANPRSCIAVAMVRRLLPAFCTRRIASSATTISI